MGYVTERNYYSVVPEAHFIQRWGFLFVFVKVILHYSHSNCEVTDDTWSTSVNQS